MTQDGQQARYLRKQMKEKGQDSDEEEQQRNFQNHLRQAINHHSKKVTTKQLEQQINYFGQVMEPFNMRNDEQIGDIDDNGFFIFKRKNQYKDAWLDSIQEQEDYDICSKLKKKIKQQGGQYLSVHQGSDKKNQDYREDELSNEEEEENSGMQSYEKQEEKHEEEQNKLTVEEIKLMLVNLLPQNSTANRYLKQLKKQKQKSLYDKIIYLCNQFIALTGSHDILTTVRQELQEQDEQQIQQNIQNHKQNKINNQQNNKQQDSDDIFS